MPDLVGHRLAQVIVDCTAAGDSIRADGAAILPDAVDEVVARCWHRAEAIVLERGNEVEVEILIGALAKLVPHAVEIGTVRPCGVAGSINAFQAEEYVGRCVVGAENFDLLVNDVVLLG